MLVKEIFHRKKFLLKPFSIIKFQLKKIYIQEQKNILKKYTFKGKKNNNNTLKKHIKRTILIV